MCVLHQLLLNMDDKSSSGQADLTSGGMTVLAGRSAVFVGVGRAAHQLGEGLVCKERRCFFRRLFSSTDDKSSSGQADLAFGGMTVLAGAVLVVCVYSPGCVSQSWVLVYLFISPLVMGRAVQKGVSFSMRVSRGC